MARVKHSKSPSCLVLWRELGGPVRVYGCAGLLAGSGGGRVVGTPGPRGKPAPVKRGGNSNERDERPSTAWERRFCFLKAHIGGEFEREILLVGRRRLLMRGMEALTGCILLLSLALPCGGLCGQAGGGTGPQPAGLRLSHGAEGGAAAG
eukprot:CAMPEP_0173438502 /NCGR_PEP_ID=MMETSP1357-20121228/20451_1 /TAXON_ID=77926 /ORGANISM="Hemiselmis rufescens, Strain PCC563" /LENGTH=149 /DNA_ID=CAMNT_0014403803 /DNA_START=18 /DNA_END=463 /DNA_ORIENTATION=+